MGLGRVASARGDAVGAHAAIKGEDFGGGLRTTGGDSRDLSGARDTGREPVSELSELQRSPTCVISGR